MYSLNVISTEYNAYTIDRLVPSFWQTPFPPSFAHSLWLSFRDRSEHQTYEAMEHHHFLGKSSNEVGHVPLPKGILNGRFPKMGGTPSHHPSHGIETPGDLWIPF